MRCTQPLYRNVQWFRGGLVFELVDSCITQLKAQGPSKTCNQSTEEEKEEACAALGDALVLIKRPVIVLVFKKGSLWVRWYV